MLDRQIADAPSRIEHAGLRKGIGRTGIQAGGAGPTVRCLMRRVEREFNICQYAGEKEIAAKLPVQQQSVLAPPAESGQLGDFAFHQRCRVDDAACMSTRIRVDDDLAKLFQLRMDDIVVVDAAPRISRNSALAVGDIGMRA